MIFFLDENLAPKYANLLTRSFGADVKSALTEDTTGKADKDWISFIKEKSIQSNEQWIIITRDSMHENKQILFANTPPLKFVLLSSSSWTNATGAALEEALLRHWTKIVIHAELTETGVFTIDFRTGKATDRLPPRTA